MLLPHGTIIVLVDGKTLELYRNIGDVTAPTLSRLDAPHLHGNNKNSGARHFSSSANPSVRQLEEDSHAAAVIDWLNQQVAERHVAHVVVIAAPRTLGEMRRRYSNPLRAVLVGEVNKDLVGQPTHEVLSALQP